MITFVDYDSDDSGECECECDDDDRECKCKCVSTNSRRRGLGQHRGRLKTTSRSFLIRFSVKWNKSQFFQWNRSQS